ISKQYNDEIIAISKENSEETLKRFDANNHDSLESNRDERIKKFGKNSVVQKKFNFFTGFFGSFIEPFNILLILIGITNLMLYLFLGRELEELVGFCLVIFMVFLAAITDFIQEYKSFKINNALHEMVQNTYVRVPLKSNETVTKENIFDIL